MPPPKFATERDESAPTLGTRAAKFASVWLAAPFMPHQRFIADVAGELKTDPDTGALVPRYPLVLITEPRQAGKSHQAMAGIGERCLSRRDFRAWYTAQTGSDAMDQFLKFNDEVVVGTPLERVVSIKRGNARPGLWLPNGSSLRPHPPIEDAMHGKQSDRNDIDEAWSFSESQGRDLMQAIGPTQLTRPGAQTWIWSAGGTADSTWLAGLVARGREGDPDICYVEFGVPDELDVEDLQAVADYHPAYGHTISLDSLRGLRQQFGDDLAGWARAAGNRWTEVIGGVISSAVWGGARTIDPAPEGAPVGYGVATSLDRTETAVVAAVAGPDRSVIIEVLAMLPGAYGVADQVALGTQDGELSVDPVGPSAALADALGRVEREDVLLMKSRDVAAACAGFVDGLTAGAVRVRPHPSLDAAVKVAARRALGDGGWTWSRTSARSSIAALEAATWAYWSLTHRVERFDESPVVWSPTAA